jgi:sigma-B regulation protein RsbU (phosphoserine phosphatase)
MAKRRPTTRKDAAPQSKRLRSKGPGSKGPGSKGPGSKGPGSKGPRSTVPQSTPPQSQASVEMERRFDFRSLFEFSSIINASTDLTFILGHLLLTVMGKLLALRGIVLLGDEENGFRIQNVRGLPHDLLGAAVSARRIPRRIMSAEATDARKYPWIRTFRGHGIRTVIPMTEGERIVGLVGFSASALGRELTAQQEEYLMSLANIAATSIVRATAYREVDTANRELSRKIQELNTLFELSKELNAVLDPERMVKLLMFSVMGQIGAHKCFLSLLRDGRLVHVLTRVDADVPEELLPYLMAMKESRTAASMDRATDRAARKHLDALGIQAVIPLRAQNELKGVFGVGGRMNDAPYAQADLDFLSSLGNLAVIGLENTRLFREALEKQKMEDELLIAKEIQKGLLPAALPDLPGYSLSAVNLSSKQVGGDYYDVIPLGRSRWVVAIGDVSGKGTPASLLMASLQASIRALVPLGLSLSELTGRVNDLMTNNTTQGRFITFFWGVLEPGSGHFTYVNAGHNPPLLCRADGSIEPLGEGGLILGVMPTTRPYDQGTVTVGPGDTLCLYTDGVSEAMNSAGVQFGEEKIEAILRGSRGSPVEGVRRSIVDAVTAWSGTAGQYDDITLLLLRRERRGCPRETKAQWA